MVVSLSFGSIVWLLYLQGQKLFCPPQPEQEDAYFQPFDHSEETQSHLYGAHGLVKPDQLTFPVRVLNASNIPYEIKPGDIEGRVLRNYYVAAPQRKENASSSSTVQTGLSNNSDSEFKATVEK